MSKPDLIFHPVRLRIVFAVGEGHLTVSQIAAALPDVAQATLYRHINALAEGGILRVVEERPVRGTVERTYALATPDAATLDGDDIASLSSEAHQRYFTMFTAFLLAAFSRYLETHDAPDFAADGAGYHLHDVYVNADEMAEFAARLNEALAPYRTPKPDGQRQIFSTIMIPKDTDNT